MTHFLDVPKKSNILRIGFVFFMLVVIMAALTLGLSASNQGDNTISVLFIFIALAVVLYLVVGNTFKRTIGYSESYSSNIKILRFIDYIFKTVIYVGFFIFCLFSVYNPQGETLISLIFYRLTLIPNPSLLLSTFIALIIILELFVSKRTLQNKSFLLVWSILLSATIVLLPFINSNFGVTP